MSSKEEVGTLGAFKATVAELAEKELTLLEGQQVYLAEQLAEVNEQIKSVRSVLRATNGSSNSGPKKQKKGQTPFRLGGERLEAMNTWLDGLGIDVEITSKLVGEQFPEWSESYCNMSLKWMREEGHLRLAATSGGAYIYRRLG